MVSSLFMATKKDRSVPCGLLEPAVHSVMTDAFATKSEDEARATEVLDFCNDVGGWRVSKTDDTKLPTYYYTFVKNELIKKKLPA